MRIIIQSKLFLLFALFAFLYFPAKALTFYDISAHDVSIGTPVSVRYNMVSGGTYTLKDNGVIVKVSTGPGVQNFDYTFITPGSHFLRLVFDEPGVLDSMLDLVNVIPAGTWTQKASLSPGSARNEASTFSIGTNLYVGCGSSSSPGVYLKDFWKYDETTDTWTQKANVPGPLRAGAFAFSINDKGYLGTGRVFGTPYTFLSDFYEYDTLMNVWSSKANFPTARYAAFAFSTGGKGYAGTGSNDVSGSPIYKDFYEYDPVADAWTAKQDMPYKRMYSSASVVNGNGIVYLGRTYSTHDQECWKYSPVSNTWTAMAAPPYKWVNEGSSFTVNNHCYAVGGSIYSSGGTPDCQWEMMEFNDSTNLWTVHLMFPVAEERHWGTSGNIGLHGYSGMGYTNLYNRNDLWEYDPNTLLYSSPFPPTASLTLYPNDTVCNGDPVYLNASLYGGATYQWFLNGSPVAGSGSVFYPSVSGNYSVSISTPAGTDTSNTVSITILPPTPSITAAGSVLTSSPAATYQWYLNGNPIPGANSQNYTAVVSGIYTVTTTYGSCSATSAPYSYSTTTVSSETITGAFNIYPNPISGNVYLLLSTANPGTPVRIKVFTIQGELVATEDFHDYKERINISSCFDKQLRTGIYFVEITCNGIRCIKKVIKA